MNDHHLDDLIISDPEQSPKNSKGLLTIIALAIVIVIVGMILWALIFGSDSTESPSEPNSPAAAHTRPLDPGLVPLESSNEHNHTLSAPKTPPVSTPPSIPAATPKPKPAATPKPIVMQTPPEAASTPKPMVSQPSATPQTPSVPSPEATAAALKAAAENAAKTAAASVESTQKKATVLIKNANKTVYYIQVGAFKRDPNAWFIKKLKKNGFTFITKKTGELRRVRVGPYDSYDEAKAALPSIKEKLGIDGLIVKY
jgi:DedD protein